MNKNDTLQSLSEINESFNKLLRLKSGLDELMNKQGIWERGKRKFLTECEEILPKLKEKSKDGTDPSSAIELLFYESIYEIVKK